MKFDKYHVVPENDLYEHVSSMECECSPKLKDGVVVHNSYDKREYFEDNEKFGTEQ